MLGSVFTYQTMQKGECISCGVHRKIQDDIMPRIGLPIKIYGKQSWVKEDCTGVRLLQFTLFLSRKFGLLLGGLLFAWRSNCLRQHFWEHQEKCKFWATTVCFVGSLVPTLVVRNRSLTRMGSARSWFALPSCKWWRNTPFSQLWGWVVCTIEVWSWPYDLFWGLQKVLDGWSLTWRGHTQAECPMRSCIHTLVLREKKHRPQIQETYLYRFLPAAKASATASAWCLFRAAWNLVKSQPTHLPTDLLAVLFPEPAAVSKTCHAKLLYCQGELGSNPSLSKLWWVSVHARLEGSMTRATKTFHIADEWSGNGGLSQNIWIAIAVNTLVPRQHVLGTQWDWLARSCFLGQVACTGKCFDSWSAAEQSAPWRVASGSFREIHVFVFLGPLQQSWQIPIRPHQWGLGSAVGQRWCYPGSVAQLLPALTSFYQSLQHMNLFTALTILAAFRVQQNQGTNYG